MFNIASIAANPTSYLSKMIKEGEMLVIRKKDGKVEISFHDEKTGKILTDDAGKKRVISL